jgi:hypothetical protein
MEQESSIFEAPKAHNKRSFRYKSAMMMKTILSTRNILLLMIYKHTPLNPKHNSVKDIANYMKIKKTCRLQTGRQISSSQLFKKEDSQQLLIFRQLILSKVIQRMKPILSPSLE